MKLAPGAEPCDNPVEKGILCSESSILDGKDGRLPWQPLQLTS